MNSDQRPAVHDDADGSIFLHLKYAIMINGVTKLFMTKADVMSGFKTIKICTSYKIDGKEHNEILFDNDAAI